MATGGAEPLFIDTNVLVYSSVAEAPLHGIARRMLETHASAGARLWISRQVLREFLAVLTRPQQFTLPVSMQTLATAVGAFQDSFQVADDTAEVTAELLAILEQVPCGGKQVHDANIVATMRVHGIGRLLTANAGDFARFTHLITVLPLEAVS